MSSSHSVKHVDLWTKGEFDHEGEAINAAVILQVFNYSVNARPRRRFKAII